MDPKRDVRKHDPAVKCLYNACQSRMIVRVKRVNTGGSTRVFKRYVTFDDGIPARL